MLDFVSIEHRMNKKEGVIEVFPEFIVKRHYNDLMIRGKTFYAMWDEDEGLWSTNEGSVIDVIDGMTRAQRKELADQFPESRVTASYLRNFSSKKWTEWLQFVKSCPDNYKELNSKVIFSNDPIKKKDYASHRLNYALENGDISAYDELIGTLYSPEERDKFEWAIGSIIAGDSKDIQKFFVFYGEAGSGKSTVLNIIQELFDGYYSVFEAKELASQNNQYALSAFANHPLVAIQHDGDLSRIYDNTKLNSLVSHEEMVVNEKYTKLYTTRFDAILFMGTNSPVKITEAKSGLIRRLIDIRPTGERVTHKRYDELMSQINFELGAIAYHCLHKFKKMGKTYYDNYRAKEMMGSTNEFYNFMLEQYELYSSQNFTTLKQAWSAYKDYCDDALIQYRKTRMEFKTELRNYFDSFEEETRLDDGSHARNVFMGFRPDRFESNVPNQDEDEKDDSYIHSDTWLEFKEQDSLFDALGADFRAQYAAADGSPKGPWNSLKTRLKSLNTHRLHYVLVPLNHIVIDFDIKDENGNKSLERNIEAASKWPKTYAELSKSGQGIHLHYIYTGGDPLELADHFDEDIEIKVFNGYSSLRRMLTKCNDIPIAELPASAKLPKKEKKGGKMVDGEVIKNEKAIVTIIKKNLNKEYHGDTRSSIDFIAKTLDDAYNSGIHYDVRDMRSAIQTFAANSTHQSEYCIKKVKDMHFCSDDVSEAVAAEKDVIIFYDVEVFPNLFVVCWKAQGDDKSVVKMINPSSVEIEELCQYKLIGFNNRKYDNHILYARMMGYNNEQLYRLSQRLINNSLSAGFNEAYNLSYTDVYDFSAEKKSLKKFEIELGLFHLENEYPWDEPVAEEHWQEVADYCANDVIATEKVFENRYGDFIAREILADLAGMTVNDTTNQLTQKIIFQGDKNPQRQFNYRKMGEIVPNRGYFALDRSMDIGMMEYGDYHDGDFTVFDEEMRPIFPGYYYEYGKSFYRGEEVGEGGYVYSEPGMYVNVALLDIASMHPSSAIAEQLFGEYTKNFEDLKKARIAIKHKDFEALETMLQGRLMKWIDEKWLKALTQALKIAINSVYGLTSAGFANAFRDPRNVDNIVAKRGALFMINLKHEVQKRGFTVAHIKTDSIKIPNATPEIIKFVTDYGKLYKYDFEHEATYDRMCLVNDAVYIAKYSDDVEINGDHAGQWTATGTQFQVPYVFKTLFSHEPVEFQDLIETKSVTTALYLDFNEGYPDVSELEDDLKKVEKWIKWSAESVTSESQNAKKEPKLPSGVTPETVNEAYERLENAISNGHNYKFVGKVGAFIPVISGVNGGLLMRKKDGKYLSATGAKGYRWMEAEAVKTLEYDRYIDWSYYQELADEAIAEIQNYCNFEEFAG